MSIDDEITALEQRRDKCLADIDGRVDRLIHHTKSALSITHLVQRFPFAAVGAALSAGLLASGSPKKIWVFLSHILRSSIAANRHSKPSAAAKSEAAPSQQNTADEHKGGAGSIWRRVAPVVQTAAPMILERIPWAKIRQSIQSRTNRPTRHEGDAPQDHKQ